MKKVRCKKEFGVWYYNKIMPNIYNDLDAPIYELYDENQKLVNEFGSHGDMIHYIKTGELI